MARQGLPILTRWVLRTSPDLVVRLSSPVVGEVGNIATYYVGTHQKPPEFKLFLPSSTIEVYRAPGFDNYKLVFFTSDSNDNNFAYATSIDRITITKATETRKAIDLLDCPWYDQIQSAKIFERIVYNKSPQITSDFQGRQSEHPLKRK